jgi:hypothetical protein
MGLIVLYISILNNLSQAGDGLATLYQTAAELRLQNEVLENKIASESSLLVIEKKAKAMGFEKIKTIQSLRY